MFYIKKILRHKNRTYRFIPIFSLLASILLIALSGLTLNAWAATVPPEVQVTKSEIIDFEFDQTHALLTFTDRNSKLWIAKVDPVTGGFKPSNGRGLLVDTGAAFMADFGNGPEWLISAAGTEIVYTKYLPNQPQSPATARVAHAVSNNGVWIPNFIDDEVAYASPLGNSDKDDPIPRITYQSSLQSRDSHPFYWRELYAPASEELVPNTQGSVGSRRWVEGMRAVVFSSTFTNDNGVAETQCFLYDVDTKVLEQLTFDDGEKGAIFMWKAPEFDNEYVFFSMVNRNEIRVYRKIAETAGADPRWTAISSIVAPRAIPNIWSPEFFTHNDKSYIFFTLSPSPVILDMRIPTYLALTDLSSTGFRMLHNTKSLIRVRSDPELFVTSNGPYIYYNSYIPQTDTSPAIQDGVWRVDPGLGPTQ
ncbi:hypothetical protein Nit79A3_1923 [Nitrosomonas sp. Is79A3]|uniref:hypothetical protein n=1 Tax=Nitrosomonas sp. (strain Is79A3) TaxID=261292 RepID=UPI000215CD3D